MRVFISIFLFFLVGNASVAFGQRKFTDKYYAYDKNWNGVTSMDSATYFSRVRKISDTCWEVHNYNLVGPMISKEVYKDEQNKVAHGTWVFYKPTGYMDSVCDFVDNYAQGSWYYFNDTGRAYKEKKFQRGRLVEVIDLIKRDSIREANGGNAQFEIVEKESEFKGAINGWRKYLERKLNYPERALKGNIQGMVVVQFVVDTEGKIGMIDLYKSVELSLDDEAKRLIITSPAWEPAVLNGKKVKSYKRQPIVFRTE